MKKRSAPKFPNRIKEIRLAKGLKQHDVASALECSAQQASRLERGERKLTQEWMVKLAKALGSDPADFFPRKSADSNEKGLNIVKEAVDARISRYVGMLPVEGQERVLNVLKASIIAAYPALELDDVPASHAVIPKKRIAKG